MWPHLGTWQRFEWEYTTTTAVSSSRDGNTVHLENELMQMNQNAMTHALETQLISGMLSRLQMAITGKT